MKRPAVKARGLTLIELTVAMMIAGGLLVAIATLFSKVMAANSAAADHLHGIVALADLGRQFRDDVRAADSAATSDADGVPQRLLLSLADGSRVEYAITTSGLRRTQTADDRPQRRNAFVLQGTKVLGFKANTAQASAISIVLGRVTHRPGDEDAQSGQFEITAVAPRHATPEANQ